MGTTTTDVLQPPVLHRAAWVLPIFSEPLENGAVLVYNGIILAVGRYNHLRKALPSGTRILDYDEAAIIPGLVNAHTHLELSMMKGTVPFPRTGFTEWLEVFFPLRAAFEHNQVLEGFAGGMQELLDHGTVLCGDVTNGTEFSFIDPAGSLPERRVFLELLGFNCESVAAALPPGVDPVRNGADFVLTPHSAYSASPRLIAATKARGRRLGLPFSIHVAEHPEEIEFLHGGTGFCRDLLERLGRWDPRWRAPCQTPLQYLNNLGVMDRLTILVHAVHMSDEDWRLTAEKKCTVCFCPRSNFNLGVGRPDIDKALSLGIPACLGTDSLASNTDLSLFAEAGFVLDNYPEIRPEAILRMITLHPARALCREFDYGGIRPGLVASLLAVSIGSEKTHISEALIQKGKGGDWKWVNPPTLN